MSRKMIRPSVILGALVVAVLAVAPRIDFYMQTGRFSPVDKIETLQNPIAVTHWTSEGLILADGRMVQVPGLRALPNPSAALMEATKRGVEIGIDGRLRGLVRIHHWCGNDPVREHIARVDLADMMTFLRVGEPVARVPNADFLPLAPGGQFTEWGWNVSEYVHFCSWLNVRDSSR